jgi:ElaB/YqjD/DUF883 family membrane-anchored ribosome-binding protein
MEKSSNTPPTLESVWAAFRETDRLLKESREEFKQEMKESRERFEREMKESREEFDRRIKKQEELAGAHSNNLGKFAEDYFSNSFEKGKRNFFGEEFEELEKNVKGIKKGYKDEYDVLLINGQALGIIEIKFKAHENDLQKVLKKAQTFRINFPEYQNHKVYLGLATMAFYPELEQECKKQGVAIIKQAGDTMVIYDEHLKVF